MLLERYLKVVLGLVAFDSIVLTFTYSALRDSSLAPLILASRMVVDIIFLAFAWRYIKLTKIELTLIFILVLSCLFATLPNLQYSSAYSTYRFFNDILGPLLFVFKVSALRSLFRLNTTALNVKKLSKILIYLSALQVLIFIYFASQTGAYAGITPPINIPAAFYIGTYNYLGLAATVMIIALSGKRSFLVSVTVVFVIAMVFRGSGRSKFLAFILLISLVTLFLVLGNDKIEATLLNARQLLDLTEIRYIDFNSEEVRSTLYFLTAGRSEEFYGILAEMTPSSWFVGLGPGFTYSIMHIDGLIEGYANAHFSPLSLTYKFGMAFTLLFYYYLIRIIYSLTSVPNTNGFVIACALFIFLLQSFFAFNFYAELYFPIFLALGMAIISETRNIQQ